MNGKLYDSFSIESLEEDKVVVWCAPSLGYKNQEGKAQLVDMRVREGGEVGTITCSSWKELTHKLTTDPVLYVASFDPKQA